jgi:hypothetical protein
MDRENGNLGINFILALGNTTSQKAKDLSKALYHNIKEK